MLKPRADAPGGSRIIPMKRPVLFALLLAVPIEGLNLVFPFPVDVGLETDAGWLEKLWGFQWVFLHWPGLYVSNYFERVGFFRLSVFVIFASGYLDTALLIVVCVLAFRWIPRLTGKFLARRANPPAN